MTLSKLITANNLEAMAAPEMKTRARMRRNETVFCTVDGAKLDGNEYASVILTEHEGSGFPTAWAFLFSVWSGVSARDAVR